MMEQTKSPAYESIIRPKKGFVAIDFGELWRYRELFVFLAWRDILGWCSSLVDI